MAAFLPFIIGGWKNRGASALLTPFEVYFGGLGKYPYIALNTYNLYGIGNLNWVPGQPFPSSSAFWTKSWAIEQAASPSAT